MISPTPNTAATVYLSGLKLWKNASMLFPHQSQNFKAAISPVFLNVFFPLQEA